MGLYEGIKDVAKVVQQADNVELYKKLLDLSSQALDMQAEIARLKEENTELKKKRDVSENIVRHELPFVTLQGDTKDLYYCSHCWDSEQRVIQLNCGNDGQFECPHCHSKGIYDMVKKQEYYKKQAQSIANVNRKMHRNNLFDSY